MLSLPQPNGRGSAYELTKKGHGLNAVCRAMGEWGARWLEIEPRHLDPAYAVWATCRLVDLEKVPRSGVVVRIDLQDERNARFWMLLQRPRAEVCTAYPGRPEDLILTTDSETLAQFNLRRITFDDAVRSRRCQLDGQAGYVKAFPTWVRPSPFAHVSPAR